MLKNALRTTHDYRRHQEAWARTAPANDSEICPPPNRWPERPRWRTLAPELAPLLTYRVIYQASEEQTSQWVTEAGNDNKASGGRPSAHAEIELRPTPAEIMDRLQGVDWSGLRLTGDVEYNANGILIRAGGLKFAIGEEEFDVWYNGQIERRRIPCGELLYYRSADGKKWYPVKDEAGTPLGGGRRAAKAKEKASLGQLRWLLDRKGIWPEWMQLAPVRSATGVSHVSAPNPDREILRSLGVDGSVPFNEARARHGLPPVIKGKSVLPTWRNPWGGFLGMRRTRNCRQSVRLEAPHELTMASTSQYKYIRAQLGDDVKLLDLHRQHGSFEQIGKAMGFKDKKTARRRAREEVIRVTGRLREIIRASE